MRKLVPGKSAPARHMSIWYKMQTRRHDEREGTKKFFNTEARAAVDSVGHPAANAREYKNRKYKKASDCVPLVFSVLVFSRGRLRRHVDGCHGAADAARRERHFLRASLCLRVSVSRRAKRRTDVSGATLSSSPDSNCIYWPQREGRIQSAERAVPTHHDLKATNLLSA